LQDGVWRLSSGDGDAVVTVMAQPLFESPVRMGFAMVQTVRKNGSVAHLDRVNLLSELSRKRYRKRLAEREIVLADDLLVALGVASSSGRASLRCTPSVGWRG
jgi:hypothetical protein